VATQSEEARLLKRTFIVALLVGAQIVAVAGTSKAETGWAWRHKAWVRYSFTFHAPDSLKGRGLVYVRAQQRQVAIHEAAISHDQYVTRLKKALARARALINAAQTAISNSGGFPATCVANAEESGHNSTAGYFGFIYSPSSYGPVASRLAGTYGSSWLNWPWSAQLQVALDLYSRYGGSAWGPLTRSKCGI
jgi:hypothetical protein